VFYTPVYVVFIEFVVFADVELDQNVLFEINLLDLTAEQQHISVKLGLFLPDHSNENLRCDFFVVLPSCQ
jgi:hypothetical protein